MDFIGGYKEAPRSRVELRKVLGAAFEPARSSLRVLLERPEFFSPEQRRELVALVGPEWRHLGVDIELYRTWSSRATALLRAIDGTKHTALSDAQWTALLSEARKAVKEVHVTVSHIELRLRRSPETHTSRSRSRRAGQVNPRPQGPSMR
jgi:hypothetical protein